MMFTSSDLIGKEVCFSLIKSSGEPSLYDEVINCMIGSISSKFIFYLVVSLWKGI